MSPAHPIHLFVLIDALGWRFLEGRAFLADLLPYRAPLRTVLGFSSGAIPTILTGLPPARTGHWNLFYYDPEGSPYRWLRAFLFLPDGILEHRVTRKLLKELGRHVLGLGPLFECCVSPRLLPWFNYVEKQNIYDCGAIAAAPSIFDHAKEKGTSFRVYSYHQWTDKQIFHRVREDLRNSDTSLFFVYLSELDLFLHNHCVDAGQVSQQLNWYARELAELYQHASRIDPEAKLTVFSDHGMTPVRHHYDLVAEMEGLHFRMPDDYLAVYDSTMARFWFFNPQARQAIPRRLETLPCGRIIPDEELQRLGVFFPDRRYGERIFLMHPGWLLSRSDFNGRGWMPVGMHGYHPEDPDSDGIFLSNRQPPVCVTTVADVYACMREAIRLEVG
jgi:predicted AlkP superfamily pyrophosphatase or phosphodiesterase